MSSTVEVGCRFLEIRCLVGAHPMGSLFNWPYAIPTRSFVWIALYSSFHNLFVRLESSKLSCKSIKYFLQEIQFIEDYLLYLPTMLSYPSLFRLKPTFHDNNTRRRGNQWFCNVHLYYSCCLWGQTTDKAPADSTTLNMASISMLRNHLFSVLAATINVQLFIRISIGLGIQICGK